MHVNVHYAKTHLSKLIAAVERGEEVVIARAGRAAVKLVAIAPQQRKPRKLMQGAGIGKIWVSPDWDSAELNLEIQELFEGSDSKLL